MAGRRGSRVRRRQQVGQFGNLGGQFGFQGGRQSADPATELVVLIQTVVDPGYWDPDVSFLSRQLLTGQNTDDPADAGVQVEAALRNKMMFNLTTRSLVIFGRSRFHRSTPGRPLKKDEVAAGARRQPGRAGDREDRTTRRRTRSQGARQAAW